MKDARIPRTKYNTFFRTTTCPHCGTENKGQYASLVSSGFEYRIRYHRCKNPKCYDTYASFEMNTQSP